MKPGNKFGYRGTAIQRFFRNVRFVNNGCWIWHGAKTPIGYGKFSPDCRRSGPRKRWLAHRWAYITIRGEIPHGLEPHHKCNNPSCVNPFHLEAITHRENVILGTSPIAINARKTHCKNGHSLSGSNLYLEANGTQRRCRKCAAIRRLARYLATGS